MSDVIEFVKTFGLNGTALAIIFFLILRYQKKNEERETAYLNIINNRLVEHTNNAAEFRTTTKTAFERLREEHAEIIKIHEKQIQTLDSIKDAIIKICALENK